jgi:Ca2+-binding RTX toxin-like protein
MPHCGPIIIETLDQRLLLSVSVVGHNLRITGTNNNDVIIVTQFSDHFTVRLGQQRQSIPRTGIKQIVAYGLEGDDKIDLHGCTVHVLVNGDEGDDTILGGRGNDRIFGGQDDDLIKGGAGNDTMEGGDGEDKLYGNAGDDSFHTDDVFWEDSIDGGAGRDRAKIDIDVGVFNHDHVDNVEDVG